ncbi:MAG: phage integrase SAM-like domain-containing protein [Sphingobacteriaceae bacterium]|nr:phage integrase SAM-like domain-containing protein [Sphingobacteriaceae bacterium]
MSEPKIIFYKHKTYSDGTSPIIIQYVERGKPFRKVISKCLPTEWLKSKNRVSSKNIQYVRINDEIEKALKEFGTRKNHTLSDYWGSFIENLKKTQQVSLYNGHNTLKDQVFEYFPKVDFRHLDKDFIIGFTEFLKIRKDNKEGTIRTKMQQMGKLLKEAIKDKLLKEHPMSDLTFPKGKNRKEKLNVEEMKAIKELEYSPKMDLVRDFCMAAFYLRGIRVGDLLCLTVEDIKNGRVSYFEIKTGKFRNIAIVPELKIIFDRQCKSKHGYVFDFINVPKRALNNKFLQKREIMKATAKIRYWMLKMVKVLEIHKKVSPHTIRHSFSKLANIIIKNTVVTKDLVGHSSLEIHENYISDISDDLEMDEYADSVIEKLR